MIDASPVRVLNVNDDESHRYILTRTLKQAGFQVIEAMTGTEALTLVSRERPEVVVLDVSLPDIDGNEVCRRIKQAPETSATPVLMISALLTQDEDRVRGLESGADAYLTEPATAEVFMATLRALLRARRAEEALRASEARFRRLFDANLIGIVLADDEHILEANDAFLSIVGYSRADLDAGRVLWRHMTPPEYAERDERGLKELMTRGECTPFEKEYIRKDGTRVPILIGAALLEPSPRRWISFVMDQGRRKQADAERERARAEAEAANVAKDEFIAMLGHELRNPIGTIRTAVGLLAMVGKQQDPALRAREVIARQTDHLGRLVDDLLDVGRIATGKIVLERAAVDLREIVTRCIATLEGSGQTYPHTVEVHAEPVWTSADATRIEQILINLVTNAVKFTPGHGTIRVMVRPEGDRAVIRVEDTGMGIQAEMLPRIFDLFVQGTRGLHRAPGGLGIGLTLVRRLVELHGGTIEARSDGPGRGSVFTVALPRIAAAVDDDRQPPPRSTSTRLRILVVEDNKDSCQMLQSLLELWGHDVLAAFDGTTGVEMALRHRPDVALVDIGLPGLDGYEVARRLRADPAGAKVVLIALTGYGSAEDRKQALDAGFDAHVVKPVEPERLESLLAALDGRERLRSA